MTRKMRWVRVLALLVILLGTALAPALHAGASASGAPREHSNAASAPLYLAIGASESLGWQPRAADGHGGPTDEGYASDVRSMEQGRWPGIRVVELGCAGITVQGALDGSDACDYPDGSEVATAVQLLRSQGPSVKLVTVDLGFNDVAPCLLHELVDHACIDRGLEQVARDLPVVFRELNAAAGSRVVVVGLQHGNPYVADADLGASAFARASSQVLRRLNDELLAIYATAGAAVARVPDAGAYLGPTLRVGAGAGYSERAPSFEKEVAAACTSTWMCVDRNLHPNDTGYSEIATAIAVAITRSSSRAVPTAGRAPTRGARGSRR